MSESLTLKHQHPEIIATSSDDVYLRKVSLEDISEMNALIETNKDFLQTYQPWVNEYKLEDSPAHINKVLEKMDRNEYLQYRIVEKDTDAIVGVATIYEHDKVKRTAFRGMWLIEDAQGKGYASASAHALMDYAFNAWDLLTINSEIDERNVRAQTYARKLGARPAPESYLFKPDGQYYRVWSIDRER